MIGDIKTYIKVDPQISMIFALRQLLDYLELQNKLDIWDY